MLCYYNLPYYINSWKNVLLSNRKLFFIFFWFFLCNFRNDIICYVIYVPAPEHFVGCSYASPHPLQQKLFFPFHTVRTFTKICICFFLFVWKSCEKSANLIDTLSNRTNKYFRKDEENKKPLKSSKMSAPQDQAHCIL